MNEDGWAWGQLAADRYVGYMPGATLGAVGPAPTHKVAALRTFVYPGPSLKRPPAAMLSFGSQLAVERMEGTYAVISGGGYVPTLHLAPASALETDFVAVAERFVGTPYLWGGKTSIGMDCSAVVQLALAACGIPCPRDTDMQEQALGTALPSPHDIADVAARRSDVLARPRRHRSGCHDAGACQRHASHGSRRSSRSRKRSREFAPPAAKSPACAGCRCRPDPSGSFHFLRRESPRGRSVIR